MKVYTKTGDKGKTSLPGKNNISKTSLIFNVLGLVDELNASLGIAISSMEQNNSLFDFLIKTQNYLFDLGAEVAQNKLLIDWKKRVEELEKKIDYIDETNTSIHNFVLPGGSVSSSHLHLSRVICRRAEREFWRLEEVSNHQYSFLASYLNRLSDFLFVCARKENDYGKRDVLWKKNL